jgi:predicted metalloprotease
MRWTPGGESQNVEDRRGSSGFGMARMGIGGTVVLLVLSLIFGRDFVSGSGGSGSNGPQTVGGEVAPVPQSSEEAKEVQFVSFVLDTAQATWASILPRQMGTPWHDAKLVLFRNATQTGCGVGQEAMGPFYCPLDQKIYIDLGFYDDLRSRFGAPGDFAQAYVLTHELGHHVQHLLGIDERVRRAQVANPDQANALSVRLELQADCFAGIWAHETEREQMLESGDVEEALNAASSVGDDRIQRATTGHVNADTFTHGTATQRATWFRRGFDSGNPKDCDTFASA